MVILGIDPGTATTGFGIIEKQKNGQWIVLDFGVINTDKKLKDAERLLVLGQDLTLLIKKYKPKAAGVEKLYFETNAKTAMTVAQARGVVLLRLMEHHIPILEFTPLEVKNTITGYGKADKKQMQFMVQKEFSLKTTPKPDDAADALGIALCTAMSYKHLSM